MDLQIQLGAGVIKRYHTITIIGEQTVGEHTYGVVQILRHITGDLLSTNLLKAALDHDVLEYYTGDVPHPTKKAFPTIQDALALVEDDLMLELGIDYELTEEEVHLLHMADMLEMGVFATSQLRLGNRGALDIMNNVLAALHGALNYMPQPALDMYDNLLQERRRCQPTISK